MKINDLYTLREAMELYNRKRQPEYKAFYKQVKQDILAAERKTRHKIEAFESNPIQNKIGIVEPKDLPSIESTLVKEPYEIPSDFNPEQNISFKHARLCELFERML